MYVKSHILFFLLMGCMSANAQLSVTMTRTSAGNNAFAPLDKTAYYHEQIVENVSPAIATSSGDWAGTNIGGTTPTWHWVSTSGASVTTQSSQSNLTVSGNGTFMYEITTTVDFINPNSAALLYLPGSGSDYRCVFSTSTPGTYSLNTSLLGSTLIQLYSIDNDSYLLNSQRGPNAALLNLNSGGQLPPGNYALRANTGTGGATNVGASHIIRSGGFTNFNFTVSVPEPSLLGAAGLAGLFLRRRR